TIDATCAIERRFELAEPTNRALAIGREYEGAVTDPRYLSQSILGRGRPSRAGLDTRGFGPASCRRSSLRSSTGTYLGRGRTWPWLTAHCLKEVSGWPSSQTRRSARMLIRYT